MSGKCNEAAAQRGIIFYRVKVSVLKVVTIAVFLPTSQCQHETCTAVFDFRTAGEKS